MQITVKNLKKVKWWDIIIFKNDIFYCFIGKDLTLYPDCGCSFHEIGYDDGFYAEEIFEKYKGFEMFNAELLKKP